MRARIVAVSEAIDSVVNGKEVQRKPQDVVVTLRLTRWTQEDLAFLLRSDGLSVDVNFGRPARGRRKVQ